MSADRPERFVDDRDGDAHRHDPHDLVPDNFVQAWNRQTDATVTTIPEALAVAERAPSSTPHGEFRRCPECQSVKVRHKCGSREIPNERDGEFKCEECGEHFSNPGESREDAMPGEQATFREVMR